MTNINLAQEYTFTVVIPVFNEEESLPFLFAELEKYQQTASVKTCFLLIDDCSSDNSLPLIIEQANKQAGFYYASHIKRQGLSGALKTGFNLCTTKLVGYMDADLQTIPSDFERLLPLMHEVQLACGIRASRQDSTSKRLQSKMANKIRNFITHDNISDTNCPLKILDSKLAKALPLFNGMHRFIPALTILMGYKLAHADVMHFERKKGVSKFNFFNRAFAGAIDLIAFMWIRSRYISPLVGKNNLEIKTPYKID